MRTRRLRIPAVLCVMLLVMGCAKTVRLAPSEYKDPGGSHLFVIRTVDGKKYRVAKYTCSDSTIVVSALRGDSPNVPPSDRRETPFEIPLDEVASIDKATPDEARWFLTGVLIAAVVLVGAIFMAGYPDSD